MSGIRVDPARDAGSLEAALARVLQAGTYGSIALVAIGVALFLAGGGSPLDAGEPMAIERLLPDILGLRPDGFLWLGILATVLTPGVRVAGALVGFVRRGELAMAGVAALILLVVAAGVIAGLVTG